MPENVVRLKDGIEIPNNGTEPSVVDLLDEMLTAAKRGEIVAIAVACVGPNQVIRTRSAHVGHRHMLVAGAHYLLRDLAE